MKAVAWQGFRDISVEEVADPVIKEPNDAIIEVTSTVRHRCPLRVRGAPIIGFGVTEVLLSTLVFSCETCCDHAAHQ